MPVTSVFSLGGALAATEARAGGPSPSTVAKIRRGFHERIELQTVTRSGVERADLRAIFPRTQPRPNEDLSVRLSTRGNEAIELRIGGALYLVAGGSSQRATTDDLMRHKINNRAALDCVTSFFLPYSNHKPPLESVSKTKMTKMTLEACVESVDEAIHAVENGATQLEVCSNLEKDGLTPEIALIKEITEQVHVPIKVMIRLRAGNFTYHNDEIKSMQESIQQIKSLPISGLVFGATVTDANGNKIMDMNAILQICKAAHPIPVTIHKAIDECTDILKEVRALKTISNIAFILTSGGQKLLLTLKK